MIYAIVNKDGFFCHYCDENFIPKNGFTKIELSQQDYSFLESLIIKKRIGNQWIEGATPEEIAEANKPKVPCSISRMRLKLELFERNITVEDIVDTITSIPSSVFSEAEKQKALIKFQEATSYDRYNADLNLIATLMGLSQEDLDEIFINGNQ